MEPTKNSKLPIKNGMWTLCCNICTCPSALSYIWHELCMDPSTHKAGPAISKFRACLSNLKCPYPLYSCNCGLPQHSNYLQHVLKAYNCVLLRIQDFKRRQWNAVDNIDLNFITKLQKRFSVKRWIQRDWKEASSRWVINVWPKGISFDMQIT